MTRVKRGVTSHSKHKKVLKKTKGFYGRRKNTIRVAKSALERSQQYSFRDRKNRKRDFRSLWIQRINASVRLQNLTYGCFISGLSKEGININRKILSNLAVYHNNEFSKLIDIVKNRNTLLKSIN